MAVAYCNWRTEKDLGSSQLCYQRNTGQKFDDGMPECDLTKLGYRLLTEAEWEYACRAGTSTRFCFGEAEALLPRYAEVSNGVERVGTRRPNAFGLFDMHGSVGEWCGSPYERRERKRILRGGSFPLFRTADAVGSPCRPAPRAADRNSRFSFGEDLRLSSFVPLPLKSSPKAARRIFGSMSKKSGSKDASVSIGRDATGNIIITGDNNVVTTGDAGSGW